MTNEEFEGMLMAALHGPNRGAIMLRLVEVFVEGLESDAGKATIEPVVDELLSPFRDLKDNGLTDIEDRTGIFAGIGVSVESALASVIPPPEDYKSIDRVLSACADTWTTFSEQPRGWFVIQRAHSDTEIVKGEGSITELAQSVDLDPVDLRALFDVLDRWENVTVHRVGAATEIEVIRVEPDKRIDSRKIFENEMLDASQVPELGIALVKMLKELRATVDPE